MKLMDGKYALAYKREMEKVFSKPEADLLWNTAESAYQRLLEENPNQPEAVAKHTRGNIFPAIAVYKTVAAKYPAFAMKILENGAAAVSKVRGSQYAKLLRIPGLKGVFLKIFSKGVKSGFGPEAGFSHEFMTDSNRELAFHVTKCPYKDYCDRYGCGEIVRVFCKNDEYAYGNLQGIRFIRTQTLGTGGSCCDFRLKR